MNRTKGILFATSLALSLPTYAELSGLNTSSAIGEFKNSPAKTLLQQTKIEQAMKQAAEVKQSTNVRMSTTLKSIAEMSDALNTEGKGSVSYWMRTAVDFARTARAIGDAYLIIVPRISSPTDRAALLMIAEKLRNTQAGTKGDVDYWYQRALDISAEVQDTKTAVINITYHMGPERIHTHTAIRALAVVMTSSSYNGTGDVDYWVRAARNMVVLAHTCGYALERFSQDVPDPLFSVLGTYVNQLKRMQTKGEGDQDYWADRTKLLSEELDDIGVSILKLSKNT